MMGLLPTAVEDLLFPTAALFHQKDMPIEDHPGQTTDPLSDQKDGLEMSFEVLALAIRASEPMDTLEKAP